MNNAEHYKALPKPVVQPGIDFSTISTHKLPIPVVFNEHIAAASSLVTVGQIASTASHHAVWLDAQRRNLTAVIVLEDDVVLTPRATRNIPRILRDAHLGSRRHSQPWHWIFLRRIPVARRLSTSWHGRVRRAPPTWGTAAYTLSSHDIRFMLDAVHQHEAPLDVAVAHLQRNQGQTGFVALDACAGFRSTYDTLTAPVPLDAQGECAFSTTEVSSRARMNTFPCKL